MNLVLPQLDIEFLRMAISDKAAGAANATTFASTACL